MLNRRIKLRHLECFATIARLGSLKAACDALHLSQPALSKTLKELEDALGARLMERDRGGICLTPEGAVFLECAGASLAALRRGVDGVSAIRRGEGERLRVGALPSVAARLLPDAVARFRALSPGTRLDLLDGGHDGLTAQLKSGSLDMVVGRLGVPATMQGLSFTQLYLEPVVCVVRPDHPLVNGAPPLRDVQDWPVLYPPAGAAIRPLLDRWCMAQGLGAWADRIETVSGAFGRNHVMQSDALWFISQGVVAEDIARGRLAVLPLDLALTAGPVGLMTRPQVTVSPAQQLFIRALEQASADLPRS